MDAGTIPLVRQSSRGVLAAGLVWLGAYVAARVLLDVLKPAPHWDIAIACIPVLAFFAFVWVVRRALGNIDEMQRRIHLEALALAFSTTLLVIMMLGLLDGPAGALGIPLREFWVALPVIYGICFAIVAHRYR